jgi:hypothetical protein
LVPKRAQLKKPFSAMMVVAQQLLTEERLMVRTTSLEATATTPQSFLGCIGYFLTPQVWKQAHQAMRCLGRARWRAQPLLFVLLMMTWCAGDSLPERFETARAFYVASFQRRRRPGKTIEGWQKALRRVPTRALRAVAAVLRARLQQVFASRWLVDGFIPLGCDGSGLQCPRSQQLEQRVRGKPKRKRKKRKDQADAPPQIWVTALVHLSLGLLWSWRLGKSTASERHHLVELLPTLPRRALLIADAGFIGYELLKKLVNNQVSFLIRLSSLAPLYTHRKVALYRFREGEFYYWPLDEQRAKQPPIRVRVLRIRRHNKQDVWLMTNVFDAAQLPLQSASRFYRWRWRNEGLFRTYKRTLGKVKLMSRTVAMAHREAEGSLLAVQLLLAHGALTVPAAANVAEPVLPSARNTLLEIRAEIRNVTGMYLGPRQARTYRERLERIRLDRRKNRRNKVRRRWPGRKDHTPPKPPRILTMGTILKDLAEKTLGIPLTG